MCTCTAGWLKASRLMDRAGSKMPGKEGTSAWLLVDLHMSPRDQGQQVQAGSTACSMTNPADVVAAAKPGQATRRRLLWATNPPRQAAWAAVRVSADQAVPAHAQGRQPQSLPAPAGAAAEGRRTLQTLALEAPSRSAGTAGETWGWGF